MPLDFSFSDLNEKIATNFGIADQFSMFKDDILDTYNKQATTLNFFMDLQMAQSRQELDQVINDNCPVTFTFNDKLLEVIYDASDDNLHIKKILENSAVEIGSLSLADWQPGIDFDAVYDPDTGEVIDFDGNVTAYLQDSMASSEILTTYIDAASNNIANTTSSIISDFNNSVNGLKGSSPQIDDLISRISSSTNTSGNNAGGALSVLQNIFKNITNTSVDSDGSIQFNNKTYYVQGFAYSHVIQTAVQSASTLLSGVVSIVAPILGFTLMHAFSLIGSVFSASYLESGTIPTVDDDASNTAFAVPCLQGTGTIVDVRHYVEVTNPQYLDYFDMLIQAMRDKGQACTIKLAYCDIIIWFNYEGTALNYEVYLDTDIYSTQGFEQTSNSHVDTINHVDYLTGGSSFAVPAQPNTSAESVNIRAFHMLDWVRCSKMYRTGELPKQYTGLSTDYLGALRHNIQALICICSGGSGWSSVKMDRSVTAASNEITAYWFWYVMRSGFDWDDLINDCIPQLKSISFGAANSAQALAYLLISWLDTFDFNPYRFYPSDRYLACINDYIGDTNSFKGNDPLFYLLDRGHFKVSPPSYSSKAISRTRWITLGLALGTIGTIVAANVVKAKLRPYMAKKYFDVQKKQQQYMESQDNDDFKSYWKSLKRYNLLAGFTGYSKLSKVSGWELGDTSSASMADIDGVFTKLNNITGEGSSESPSLDKIIKLIR